MDLGLCCYDDGMELGLCCYDGYGLPPNYLNIGFRSLKHSICHYHLSPTHNLYILYSALSLPFIFSLLSHSICHRTKMADGKTWPPPDKLSRNEVRVTNVTGDGNCLFYCLLPVQQRNVENVRVMRWRLMRKLKEIRHTLVDDFGPRRRAEDFFTWEDRTHMEIMERNTQGLSWTHIKTFQEYSKVMTNAGPSIPPRWGGEFELLLYPKEFNENVAVYEQVDETYILRGLFGGITLQSSGVYHLLLRNGNHYNILTRVAVSSQTSSNVIKKRKQNSSRSSINNKFGGYSHSIVPGANDVNPAAPEDRAIVFTPAPATKILTKSSVHLKKKSKIQTRYNSDSVSLNHYFPIRIQTKKKKESIVDNSDYDDPDSPEDTAGDPTDATPDKILNQLMVNSQMNSNAQNNSNIEIELPRVSLNLQILSCNFSFDMMVNLDSSYLIKCLFAPSVHDCRQQW
jgi:hypothetical protein